MTVLGAEVEGRHAHWPGPAATIVMSRPADELLYDSEAALRLVDTALHELQGEAVDPDRGAADPATLPALPKSTAALHDHLDVAHGAHVGERVAADGDHVGEHADAQRAEAVLDS